MNKAKKIITDYFWKNGKHSIPDFDNLTEVEINHIINCGTTIMLVRSGLTEYSTNFTDAIINNKLLETFSRADPANWKAIKWHIWHMHNLPTIKIDNNDFIEK